MRESTRGRRKFRLLVAGYGLLALVILMGLVTQGTVRIPLSDIIRVLGEELSLIPSTLDDGGTQEAYRVILLKLRIPRVVMAFIVGAALATSGLIFQGIFINPMAEPYVLGVSSGAAFGATVVAIFGIGGSFLGFSMVSLGAFLGALLTSFLVFTIAQGNRSNQMTVLLLSGIAISFFLSSLISLMMTLNRDVIENIFFWTMGSVSTATWDKIFSVGTGITLGIGIFIYYAQELNIILTGEDSAKALGVNVKRVRSILLYTASLVTALAVSVSGIIGFVGLIVPHGVRLLFGADNRRLLPLTAITGGLFLSITDMIGRTVVPPMEIPLGVMTALLGTPYFIYLLVRRKR